MPDTVIIREGTVFVSWLKVIVINWEEDGKDVVFSGIISGELKGDGRVSAVEVEDSVVKITTVFPELVTEDIVDKSVLAGDVVVVDGDDESESLDGWAEA